MVRLVTAARGPCGCDPTAAECRTVSAVSMGDLYMVRL